jgi:hypothetical protein
MPARARLGFIKVIGEGNDGGGPLFDEDDDPALGL